MAMKRRGFMQLLGAALAAPALPAVAPAATVAGYNRYTYGLAVFHARTRAHISARGLAHCLKVTPAQAQAMIAEMSSSGLVTPVIGSTGAKVRAVSNILRPDTWGLDAAARKARSADRRARLAKDDERTKHYIEPDLSRFIAHLRDICIANGMALHPRCLA